MPDPTDLLGGINLHLGTPITPTRSLDTPFQPAANRAMWCSYVVQSIAAEGNDGNVELRSDVANPPTTPRASARVKLDTDGAATPGGTFRQQLTYLCPPGHYISLAKTGAGTWSVVEQVEIPV